MPCLRDPVRFPCSLTIAGGAADHEEDAQHPADESASRNIRLVLELEPEEYTRAA